MKLLKVIFFFVALSACGSAKPYQRENLSKSSMDLSQEQQQESFERHVYESREGARGGSSNPGGGCGCN